jgi:hypothetical protein
MRLDGLRRESTITECQPRPEAKAMLYDASRWPGIRLSERSSNDLSTSKAL